MTARLISCTKMMAEEDAHLSVSEMIARVARVSNPANEHNNATADRLIAYLIKHHHWSPFEMVHICLEINTTRDISRQILRHRSFSFQEFSQRYAVVDTEVQVQVQTREARLQDTKNRQNSIASEDQALQSWWSEAQQRVSTAATEVYQEALSRGIAKEQARVVLPEGNTTTRLYMQGSVRSWYHYISVRSDPSTQKEHRDIALACAAEIAQVFPEIQGAVVAHNNP